MKTKTRWTSAMTPLVVIGSFITLAETFGGIAAYKTTGNVQIAFTVFVCLFPVLVAGAFFWILWARPYVFYSPNEYGRHQDPASYIRALRNNTDLAVPSAARINSPAPTAEPDVTKGDNQEQSEPPLRAEVQLPKEAAQVEDAEKLMFRAFVENRVDDAEKYCQRLLATAANQTRKLEIQALRDLWKFQLTGDEAALTDLVGLAGNPEVLVKACHFCGLAFAHIRGYGKAVEYYEAALGASRAESKPYYLAKVAESLAADGRTEAALARLRDGLQLYPKSAKLYETLADAYHSIGNAELRVLALERAVELKPANTELRFSLAWAYADQKLDDLAFFHYTALLRLKAQDPSTLNNIGVLYDRYEMPGMAVDSYRKSLGADNSLAGANLAYCFMNAGFFAEAKEAIDKAASLREVHANVGSASARLVQVKDEETKQRDEVLKNGQEQQKFAHAFAEACFMNVKSGVELFAGEWVGTDGSQMNLGISQNTFQAEWCTAKERHVVSGTVTNRSARLVIKISSLETQQSMYSLLSIVGSERKGYAYVTGDGAAMTWLVVVDNKHEKRTFHRVAADTLAAHVVL